MSRIGNKPVVVPDAVNIRIAENVVYVSGPKGDLSVTVPSSIDVKLDGKVLQVLRNKEDRKTKALHGLNRMLIANMVEGVSNGYSKELLIEGVGYKASVQNRIAEFALGYSSPVKLEVPKGLDFQVNDNIRIVISGIDKQMVGNFAARVKSLRPAEPYKGKGLRFKGEHIRRKVGKTVS